MRTVRRWASMAGGAPGQSAQRWDRGSPVGTNQMVDEWSTPHVRQRTGELGPSLPSRYRIGVQRAHNCEAAEREDAVRCTSESLEARQQGEQGAAEDAIWRTGESQGTGRCSACRAGSQHPGHGRLSTDVQGGQGRFPACCKSCGGAGPGGATGLVSRVLQALVSARSGSCHGPGAAGCPSRCFPATP